MKKKISMVLLASVICSNVSPTLNVFANEVLKDQADLIVKNAVSQAKITNFTLRNYSNFESYNSKYKVQKEDILSISNNGGQYSSSSINKAIDDNLSTHWETGKQNSSSFKNEVVFEFKNIETIDRIAYATRQDSAKGKGYPTKFKIYASITGSEDDFNLVSEGTSSSTGNMMEFKFDAISAKKIKFVFSEANQNWASASEFWFYKEDKIIDKLNQIFTDNNKNQINEEFNTLDKLEAFEEEAKLHPLYENFKEDFNNAKELLKGNEVIYKDAIVSKFKSFNDEALTEYNDLFKVKLSAISTNGGHYGDRNIEKAIDNDINTNWHSGKQNNNNFKNEVILTLDEKEDINRVVYTSLNARGFAEAFDIYVSTTTKGDTFTKVTSGSMSRTNNSMEIQFNPTTAKRVKFVFKQGYENWALASEFAVYKEDELKDKMSRLFTDNTMSEVSEEFNTVEKLEALENEAKVHPFYNDYKEDLNNAKEILQGKEIESTVAYTTSFPYGDNEAYSNEFRMPYENIKSISTNGGQYLSQKIDNAIDGDLNTYWETNRVNSATFNNEVIVEFKEAVTLDRIVYGARQSDTKGFLEQFEIYSSNTTKGDTFKLVCTGNAVSSKGLTEVKFEPTKFKRVKIVSKKGTQDWATFNEIMFYSKDNVRDEVLNMFTDKTLSALKDDYNSQEVINKLQEKVDTHPAKDDLQIYLDMAKDILNNTLETVKTVVAEQHGNMERHAQKNLQFGFGNNLQPTGVYAIPGEKIVIYVDAEEGQPLPKIFFSQQEGSWASWGNTYSLKAGKNVITVPKISQEYHYGYEVAPGGPVYIVNPYTKEEQGKAPTIRFASGCEQFPLFDKNTNEEEFIEFLKEYKAKLDADVEANPELKDRKVINTFEFVSDHVFFTGTATAAYNVYVKNKSAKPSETIASWNRYINEIFRFYGLDGNNEYDDPKYIRENVRLAQPWGYMYAAAGHIGVQGDVMEKFLTTFESRNSSNWGITHEIGHKMDVQKRLYGESTNNMLAIHMDYFYGVRPGNSVPYNKIYKNVMSENSNVYVNGDYFERIAPWWQLEMYYPGYWGEFNSYYRERNDEINILSGDLHEPSKTKYIVEFSSEIVGKDLSEFFARHGFPVSDETRKEMASKYDKPEEKIWYINDTARNYEGNGFDSSVKVISNLKRQENGFRINLSVSQNGIDDLLGYEIIKDGKVIAFTNNSYYVDEEANFDENQIYEVIAYDKSLKTIKSSELNSYSPLLSLSQEKVTLKLNEEFDARNYVKASDKDGNELTDIRIESNVDTTKKGLYEVTYTVSDNDIDVSATMEVEVVSTYKYLSDTAWTSVSTQWGTPRRNSNIKGRINGDITTFEKGFGIHAAGEIVYDLGEYHNYENFEALLGIDMNIAAQENSSVTFKVIGDGETLATTRVIKHADDMVYVNVPVKGVNKLKIEINNGGNGNTSDHTVIANPKLTINNCKPTLEVGDMEIVKLNEEFDLMKNVEAIDVEDGNITESVVINKNEFTTEKTGTYNVEYSITDNDNNTVTKTKKIVVYSETSYASDNQYTVNNQGWGGIRNDKSPSNKTISVLVNGEEKEFTKGIGAHANSEITYDLSDKNYEYFNAYIGADKNVRGNSNTSVKFKVLVDGEEVYTSKVFYSNTDAEEILVPVKGAKEVKLITDQANANDWSDQSVWAGACFLITNSKPKLTIPNSVSTKVGEEIDLDEEYSAIDAEDGDLTSKVQVEGEVNFNKAGVYELVYSVTDSDGNTTQASRKVKVVDMEDMTYLSDIDLKSSSNSYTSARKNQSVSGRAIRLTNENGAEIAYEKGIGAHSTSTLIYDLTKADYGYFTSYVGVDRQMYNTVGSVNFQVYLDNEKVYDSGTMNSTHAQKFVEINLQGAKELKLVVTDGGNGNGSDHADWADAKLHLAVAKEVIESEI